MFVAHHNSDSSFSPPNAIVGFISTAIFMKCSLLSCFTEQWLRWPHLADSGELARLPGVTSLNLRAFWKIGEIKALGNLTFAALIDNATDALILPQLGLPAPGRTFRIGIRLTP
jgi:hypothetical protein